MGQYNQFSEQDVNSSLMEDIEITADLTSRLHSVFRICFSCTIKGKVRRIDSKWVESCPLSAQRNSIKVQLD